jgi:NifU-like protein
VAQQPSNPTPASSVPSAEDNKIEVARLASIRKVLDEDIRPYVQADGGDIELVGVEGNKVKVRLHGACGTCPSSMITLRQGVETRLQAKISPDLVVEEIR